MNYTEVGFRLKLAFKKLALSHKLVLEFHLDFKTMHTPKFPLQRLIVTKAEH